MRFQHLQSLNNKAVVSLRTYKDLITIVNKNRQAIHKMKPKNKPKKYQHKMSKRKINLSYQTDFCQKTVERIEL